MRTRLPLFLIAVSIAAALTAAGCGSDKSSDVIAVPSGSTQSTGKGWTGSGGDPKKSTQKTSSGAATDSAKKTLDSCLQAAKAVPDADKSERAKQACQVTYSYSQESAAQIDKATSDARAQCEAAANKISNEQAKASTLAACAQFK